MVPRELPPRSALPEQSLVESHPLICAGYNKTILGSREIPLPRFSRQSLPVAVILGFLQSRRVGGCAGQPDWVIAVCFSELQQIAGKFEAPAMCLALRRPADNRRVS